MEGLPVFLRGYSVRVLDPFIKDKRFWLVASFALHILEHISTCTLSYRTSTHAPRSSVPFDLEFCSEERSKTVPDSSVL